MFFNVHTVVKIFRLAEKEAIMEQHNLLNSGEIPMGIGMALAENMPAMYAFTAMDDAAREAFIHNAQSIESRDEMRAYVNSLLQK